jgi:hypothetical protein
MTAVATGQRIFHTKNYQLREYELSIAWGEPPYRMSLVSRIITGFSAWQKIPVGCPAAGMKVKEKNPNRKIRDAAQRDTEMLSVLQ